MDARSSMKLLKPDQLVVPMPKATKGRRQLQSPLWTQREAFETEDFASFIHCFHDVKEAEADVAGPSKGWKRKCLQSPDSDINHTWPDFSRLDIHLMTSMIIARQTPGAGKCPFSLRLTVWNFLLWHRGYPRGPQTGLYFKCRLRDSKFQAKEKK